MHTPNKVSNGSRKTSAFIIPDNIALKALLRKCILYIDGDNYVNYGVINNLMFKKKSLFDSSYITFDLIDLEKSPILPRV